MARRTRRSFDRQMQELVHEYMQEHDTDIVDSDALASWAIKTGRYARKPPSLLQYCKREFSRAMRAEIFTDPQGRAVRRMHAARYELRTTDGQLSLSTKWQPIFEAKPDHMRISMQQRRRGILADARQHKVDVESYNDNNVHGALLPLFDYNLNEDLKELDLPTTYAEERPVKE